MTVPLSRPLFGSVCRPQGLPFPQKARPLWVTAVTGSQLLLIPPHAGEEEGSYRKRPLRDGGASPHALPSERDLQAVKDGRIVPAGNALSSYIAPSQVHVLLVLGAPELDAVLQGFIPWYSTKQIPEEAKVYSPEVQGSELAVHPHRCPKDLELHHFMVTAAKAVPELHIPHQPLLVGENKVQHSTSPCWLLYHLEKEVIINTFQEPPRLLMPSCVVPPTDIGVVEIPHEDQGLRT
ncbi:uncharacterized protein [Ciconia boyciana]|uniref:uncharacterized protein n=1 Tax=Ciconia boyciana TaxID=52775 RepID=UPI003B9E46F8